MTHKMNKRKLLKVFAALPCVGSFYTKNISACSMGMSLNYVSRVPDGYRATKSDALSEVVTSYLGRTDWVYAGNECHIKAPEFAENAAVVPLQIVMPGPASGEFAFDEVIVLVEKLVDVLATKEQPANVPNRDGQVPLNFQPNTTSTAAVFVRVAAYQFSGPEITELNMRLDLSGASKARFLALLVPGDKSNPVQVIRQKKPTVIYSCDRTIYVDGPTPAGAERGFYYF